jgi:hypothetical protein
MAARQYDTLDTSPIYGLEHLAAALAFLLLAGCDYGGT